MAYFVRKRSTDVKRLRGRVRRRPRGVENRRGLSPGLETATTADIVTTTERKTVKRRRQPRGPGRPPFASAETREALLHAAEELFADVGVEAVSMRSISVAAGLAPAAIRYHFRSKEALLDAVLQRRNEPLTRRTHQVFDALAAQRRTPTARDLFGAMTTSIRELLDRDPVAGLRWVRLIARLWLAQNPCLLRLDVASGMEQRFQELLLQAFPDVPRRVLDASGRIAVTTVFQLLSNSNHPAVHGIEKDGIRVSKAYADRVIEFVALGFGAVVARNRVRPARKAE